MCGDAHEKSLREQAPGSRQFQRRADGFNTLRILVTGNAKKTDGRKPADHRSQVVLTGCVRIAVVVAGFPPPVGLACPTMSTTRHKTTDVIDRDTPCVCGGLAARQLRDGSLECPRCGRVMDAEVAQ